MPFTPFHFGVGLVAKAGLGNRFYLTLFVALQVLIDVETLYNLMHGRYPVHRFLHTYVGAGVVAVTASGLVLVLLAWWGRRRSVQLGWKQYVAVVVTSFFATSSHVLLDSIMHEDSRPFWPFSMTNPCLDFVTIGTLHGICVACGIVGGLILLLRAAAEVTWKSQR